MDEPIKKRVDESWKEQAEREKHTVVQPAKPQPGQPATPEPAGMSADTEELPAARFDLFVSGLAMEALVSLGDMPHPTTHKPAVNVRQAKYLIDVLGLLEEKTKGNLSVDEERLLKDALYQLRMRYLSKAGGG